ncbi:MAG: gliding motility protein GldM [Breznakibacter sp.]|nr:gliding motility protein GldM [Breznakibacter sp.]
MSGGNCPETPRQKMIGMMYLFLTAMLALNVSGDLLNAFVLVDNSIKDATRVVESKNSITSADFDMVYNSNQNKSKERYEQSKKVQVAADSLFSLIQSYKSLVVRKADGPGFTPDSFASKDNQDIVPQVMLVEEGGGRSEKLKKSIEEYRSLLLGFVDEDDKVFKKNIESILNTDNPPKKDGVSVSWAEQKFLHLPMAASMALLSKLQSDVRNSQADMNRYLLGKVDEKSFKFTSVAPLVIPKSQYVLKGNKYYAEIMMAATDTTAPPKVNIQGSLLPTKSGKAIYEVGTPSVGQRSWEGSITFNGPDGQPQTLTIPKQEYFIIEPTVVISPVKMNVFYEGVDNPVRVSVPGVAPSQLQISWTNVSAKPDGDQWIIRPNPGSAGMKCEVSVAVKQGSSLQRLGVMDFRIKRVPDPVAKVAKLREGKIKKTTLVAQAGVFAEMDQFDFELEFKVTAFTVSTLRGGYLKEVPTQGNLFSKDQQELIKGLSPGAKVFFDQIKAVSASNSADRRSLGAITLTIE